MHWQKPTPNTFFLLCLTKAGTGFSSFFLAEIFISPTFSLIWGTETNKNQLKTSVWWGGLSCWSWGMWWCDSRWPRGTAPAGFWAHPSTSRQSRTIPGAWRQLGQSLIDAPGSEEPECHHLLSTGRAALGIFLLVVSQNTLIWHIALDKIFTGIFPHSKTGREST